MLLQCEDYKKRKNFTEIVKIADKIVTLAIKEAMSSEPAPRDYKGLIDAIVFVTQNMHGTRYENTPFSEAYAILGKIFETGILVKENMEKAHAFYTVAAQHSNPFGCYRLAHFYENGIGCKKNRRKALHFYKLSANGSCCRGMHRYGMLLMEGRKCKRDIKGAVFYLEQARKLATPNYPHVLYDLALCYERVPLMAGHIIDDQEYALAIYKEGDALGCPRSIVRLGKAHQYGELGIDIDLEKAIYYYMRAESISSEASYELYRIYTEQKNSQESLKWLKKSAVLGHPEGICMHAEALEKGLYGKANRIEALWWFKIAKTRGMKVDADIKRCKSN